MRLRESMQDCALLKLSESRKVTLGRIEFISGAFAFSASHPSAADITGVQERDPACWGKVEFCLTKLQVLRATSLTFATLHLIHVLNAFGLFARVKRDWR
jgi:hypothetical protein